MALFNEFGLKEELLKAVDALGFTQPSPIQEKTIPLLLERNTDIIALAQTGTGKTAAFGLPLLQKIDRSLDAVQALVLSPTRELCMQIQEEFAKYSKYLKDIHVLAVYGGAPIGAQIRALRKEPVKVVVATPGRLIDLLEKGALNLDDVRMLVLDEADEMLNMGFRDDIDFVLKHSPQREATWLFSATMNKEVRRIAGRYMKKPVEVAVARENAGNENIEHQYYITHSHQRFEALKRLMDFAPDIYGIIFTRTKQDAQDVSENLMREGYHVSPLHGDMDQKMRTKVMDKFKRKLIQVIVATDVAARGIDVHDITHVINYELPEDPEIYTHRSGRTARAGKTGICMSLVTTREIGRIRQVEKIAHTKFAKMDIPDGKAVIRKHLFNFVEKVENAEPQSEFIDFYKSSIIERLGHLEKEELISRLIWLEVKNTIENYANATDLNAGFESKGRESSRGASQRLFINLGKKDGLTESKLVQFITDMSDLEPRLIQGVTVTELSSFFNVPYDAKEFVMSVLTQKRFNGRKVRVEEADAKPGFKGGKKSYKKETGYHKSGNFEKKNFGRENPKFTKSRKQPK